jgi:hypothetical protein
MADLPARDRWLNYALYQAGWLACVAGAARGAADLGAVAAFALVAVHLALARERGIEARIVLLCGAVGLLLDSAQAAAGRIAFAGAPLPWLAPLWVVALWLQLGTILRGCLAWLEGRPALAALLGAVGGPLAFRGGERLGAAVWGEPRWLTAASLALVWGAATPLLVAAAARIGRGRAGGYRLPGPV